MQQPRLGLQRLAGDDEGAQLRLLHLGQERHALEAQHRQHQPAAGLRHGLDHQHAGQQRDGRGSGPRTPGWRRARRSRRARSAPPDRARRSGPPSGSIPAACRLRRPWRRPACRCWRRDCRRTKYSSVETFPSFTSCVHCSSGILMPNALSMAKATSRKSRLSMPRSLMAWLSGVIFSRGMSHVSAMIPATVSKVDDIDQPLRQLTAGGH